MTTGMVIVTFKCRDYALKCLDSIRDRAPALLPHTVVVDNASGDGTLDAVRASFPEVATIASPTNQGFAAAANRGIGALGHCDVICLLNPDTLVLDGGIEDGASYLRTHEEAGVLGGRILNVNGTVQASARAFPGHKNALFNRHSLTTKLLPSNRWSRRYLMTDWAHGDIREVDWVSGAFMFIHRRAIERAGVLDPGYFFSIEDVDYCRRVRDAGLSVVYFPGATIQHRIGASSRRAVYRAMAAHHRGMWRYYRKHLRGGRAMDVLTAAGISARFSLHAASYALRSTVQRVLGQPVR